MKNKKLFAILTLVCFLFTLMPVAAMADENVAVDDKGVYFTSLADAVANTTGSTIKILADTTLTGNINKDLKFVGATKDVVLDLGDTANAASSRDLIFENLTLERDNVNYKGFHHVNRETYDNCIINGQYWTYGVTAEFTDCVFNQKSSDAYNIWTYGSEAVKFENCTFNSAGKSVLVYNEGACATVLTVTDCEFNASASVEGKAAIEIDTSLMPEGSKLVIDDKTTATGFSEGTISGNSLYNGKKGNKLSVTVGGETKVDGDKYYIATKDELAAFANAVNSGNSYSKKTVYLTADIDLNNEEWTPIGNSTNKFEGTFDGDNHTISNLTITGNNSNAGLFGFTTNGEVKNLTVNNAKVSGRLNVGVVAGTPYTSKYTNIKVTGHVEVNGMAYVGGVVGKNAYADLTCITVDVDDTSYVNADSVENGTAYRTYVGGITGIAHYNNKFINCTCTGDVTITDAGDTPELEIGGIAGVWHNETGTTVTIQNCSYTGALASPGVTEFANNGLVGSAYNTTGEGTLTAENNTVKLVIPDNMAAAKIGSTNYATLQSAIDAAANGDTITLLTDVTEDVTVVQAETVKITIDGSGKTMNGSITVDGKSARYETAGVTIKNVNFLSDKNSPAAYINLGVSGNSNTRYTNHVTVENCTFDYNGTDDKVAIKSYTGGDKNLIITGCTVSENMHSLLQVTNVEEGLAISDCVVKSKNGVNINNTVSLAMTGCDFAVKGYAIRAGVSGSTSTVTKTFVIKNNVLSSNCDDGDAVIILRDSAANANISMEENAVLGTTHISGTTADTTVSADANYWDGESAPVVSGTAVTVASYYEKFEDGKLKNLIIPATDITFVKNEVSVECGKTVTLTATLAPSDATDEIVWTSSDTTIVTVDEMGNVTGAKEGTATVTVKIANGETATCTVTVTKASSSSSSSGGGFSGKYNYPVNIADTIGAAVTADQNYAVAGETVTITVGPALGKQVDEVIVTDAEGDVIPVTRVGDNKYRFTMPAGKVTVAVTTEAADYDLRIVMQINNKNIVANNRTITNDVAPVIVGDRTLVPVRIVTELLGGTADWDDATRTVTLTIDGKVMKLVIDQPIPGFGTSASIISDRTYVPIRYVAEKLGANVEWIAATQQIMIEQ